MTGPAYTQISRITLNHWEEALQAAVPGVMFTVRWNATGTILKVFVPGEPPAPDAVDKAIRAAGAVDDEYAKLGE